MLVKSLLKGVITWCMRRKKSMRDFNSAYNPYVNKLLKIARVVLLKLVCMLYSGGAVEHPDP